MQGRGHWHRMDSTSKCVWLATLPRGLCCCREHSEEQRTLLFQLAHDNLLWNKNNGGAMAGIMFWTAAIG